MLFWVFDSIVGTLQKYFDKMWFEAFSKAEKIMSYFNRGQSILRSEGIILANPSFPQLK